MDAVGLVVKRLDELRIYHTDQIVERLVRIRNAAKQGHLFLSQLVQVKFIRHRQPVDLRQVEGRQPHADAHQNRLGSFTRGLLEDAVLLDGDAVRFPFFEPFEQHIQRRLVVFIFLSYLGAFQHFHDHAEVLFTGRGLVQQVEHEGLQQGSLGFFPKWVAAFRMGRRRVLDQVGYELQHILVILHIDERVVAIRGVGVNEVKHPHLVALLQQISAGLAQDFPLRVCNDQRAAFPARSSSGGFQHVWHGIGACLARAGTTHDQDVGVVFVLVAIYPDAEVPGQQQVRPRLVHILSVQGKDIAPAGGTVFLAGAGVLLVGCNDNGDDCIESIAEQQKARRLRCVIDGERLCQKIVDGSQDTSQSGSSIPPHRQPGRCPPDERQRHQPDPPGGCILAVQESGASFSASRSCRAA